MQMVSTRVSRCRTAAVFVFLVSRAAASADVAVEQERPASFWVQKLKSKDWAERRQAARALRSLGAQADTARLALKEALTDADLAVCSDAARALWKISPGSRAMVISALVSALGHEDETARNHASHALSVIGTEGGEAAVPYLVQALRDGDPVVRQEILTVLSLIGAAAQAATGAVVEALESPQADVRLAAIATLRCLRAQDEVTVDALVQAARDPTPAVGERSIRVLGLIGSAARGAVPALGQMLEHENQTIRSAAIQALGRLSAFSTEAVGLLIDLLRTDDKNHRLFDQAIEALAKAGEHAIPVLIDALRERRAGDSYRFHGRTAKVLGRISPAAFPKLMPALRDKTNPLHGAASHAIAELATRFPHEIVPPLLKSAHEEAMPVRARCLIILGQAGKKPDLIVPTAIECLKAGDADVRANAAYCIYGLVGKDRGGYTEAAILPLIATLADHDAGVRKGSTRALGSLARKYQHPGILPALVKRLEDEDREVVRQVIRSLGGLGTLARPAVPALKRMLRDADEDFQREIRFVMKRIGVQERKKESGAGD